MISKTIFGDETIAERISARTDAACDDYWIKYPTGDPVRVVRLIARGD